MMCTRTLSEGFCQWPPLFSQHAKCIFGKIILQGKISSILPLHSSSPNPPNPTEPPAFVKKKVELSPGTQSSTNTGTLKNKHTDLLTNTSYEGVSGCSRILQYNILLEKLLPLCWLTYAVVPGTSSPKAVEETGLYRTQTACVLRPSAALSL